jgi:hypothetical protein
MKNIAKVIGVNVLVLIVFLQVINLSSVVIYQAYRMYRTQDSSGDSSRDSSRDPRGLLPYYRNIKWAQKHFEENREVFAEYKSYIGWRKLPYKGETINIDERGIRMTTQHDFATQESPLVVFLGGSTMWGSGANDSNTIPSLFTQLSQGKYRALNLGDQSYRAMQSYLFLFLQINKGLKPDIVVSYDGMNEGMGFMPQLLEASSHRREYQIREALRREKQQKQPLLWQPLSFRSFFLGPLESIATKIKNKLAGAAPYERISFFHAQDFEVSDERIEQSGRALLDSWMATKRLAENNGSLYVAILQPIAAIGQPNLEHLREHLIERYPRNIDNYKYLYSTIKQLLLSQKYKELADHVIDYSDAYDVDEHIYIDECHVTPKGNSIIAEKVLEYINQQYDIKVKRR